MKFVLLFVFAVINADGADEGHCRLNPHPSVEYRCILLGSAVGSRVCGAHEPAGTLVSPQCRTNYYSTGTLTYMQCLNGNWDYIAKCVPDCGRVTADGMELVIGGQRVRRGELPWHAGVYKKTWRPYQQICGGTLISANIVISAAHCFWSDLEKQLPASQFAVAVKVLHVPARYQGAGAHNQDDIAVVVTAREFQFNTYIRPACLNFDYHFEVQQLYPGNQGKVAGWGLTAANGKASSVLQVVDLPYVDIRTCIRNSPPAFREYITTDKICAGTLERKLNLGKSRCELVSVTRGNWLENWGIERFYLRGVVSTAPTSNNACNTAVYTSFTSIMQHEHFIKQFWIES
ncbi:Hemolymph protein 14 [Operophtera brumata]|uniref:Hemolymph protein 14 n=1 Tax=Operophtera brumata TaxID=104452 RepID=A0A0L7LKB6_OPEBR|nr:Hemolymph protein 14 [Operophtera brumata]